MAQKINDYYYFFFFLDKPNPISEILSAPGPNIRGKALRDVWDPTIAPLYSFTVHRDPWRSPAPQKNI